MIEIEKPRIESAEIKSDGTYGKFILEPLERGYGTTLGNSLRRVLLSSLPGVAVTSLKIDGVQHEFSTVPGVKEDVTEIVLNLKGLIAKIHGDAPKTVYIEKEGECEVTARDIKGDSEVEILDPGMHIATLDKNAKLYMEITLDRKLSERRIFPAIDLNRSSTRREDLLLTQKELEGVWALRKLLSNGDSQETTDQLLTMMQKTKNNEEFIESIINQVKVFEKNGYTLRGL